MPNEFTNPFAQKFSKTSLEKVFESGAEGGNDLVGNGGEGNKRREVIVRGVLSVTVISAEDLAPADLMGKADPYVVLTMKKTESKNKTRVCCSLVECSDRLLPKKKNQFFFLVFLLINLSKSFVGFL